jgi:hypothetical protein
MIVSLALVDDLVAINLAKAEQLLAATRRAASILHGRQLTVRYVASDAGDPGAADRVAAAYERIDGAASTLRATIERIRALHGLEGLGPTIWSSPAGTSRDPAAAADAAEDVIELSEGDLDRDDIGTITELVEAWAGDPVFAAILWGSAGVSAHDLFAVLKRGPVRRTGGTALDLALQRSLDTQRRHVDEPLDLGRYLADLDPTCLATLAPVFIGGPPSGGLLAEAVEHIVVPLNRIAAGNPHAVRDGGLTDVRVPILAAAASNTRAVDEILGQQLIPNLMSRKDRDRSPAYDDGGMALGELLVASTGRSDAAAEVIVRAVADAGWAEPGIVTVLGQIAAPHITSFPSHPRDEVPRDFNLTGDDARRFLLVAVGGPDGLQAMRQAIASAQREVLAAGTTPHPLVVETVWSVYGLIEGSVHERLVARAARDDEHTRQLDLVVATFLNAGGMVKPTALGLGFTAGDQAWAMLAPEADSEASLLRDQLASQEALVAAGELLIASTAVDRGLIRPPPRRLDRGQIDELRTWLDEVEEALVGTELGWALNEASDGTRKGFSFGR